MGCVLKFSKIKITKKFCNFVNMCNTMAMVTYFSDVNLGWTEYFSDVHCTDRRIKKKKYSIQFISMLNYNTQPGYIIKKKALLEIYGYMIIKVYNVNFPRVFNLYKQIHSKFCNSRLFAPVSFQFP